MLPTRLDVLSEQDYRRGDVRVDERGYRVEIGVDSADALKVGRRQQRRGLCYTSSNVEHNFVIYDPADGDILLALDGDEGGSELEAWLVQEDEEVLRRLVEDTKFIVDSHARCREADGEGVMVGAGEHARCAT